MSDPRPRVSVGYVDDRWTVAWPADPPVLKSFDAPPYAVLSLSDPAGVLIVEQRRGRNAAIYNRDGGERVQLLPPAGAFTEFGQAFIEDGRIAIVVMPAWERGFVDTATGEIVDVEPWMFYGDL